MALDLVQILKDAVYASIPTVQDVSDDVFHQPRLSRGYGTTITDGYIVTKPSPSGIGLRIEVPTNAKNERILSDAEPIVPEFIDSVSRYMEQVIESRLQDEFDSG